LALRRIPPNARAAADTIRHRGGPSRHKLHRRIRTANPEYPTTARERP
jgi:hypothetical protein